MVPRSRDFLEALCDAHLNFKKENAIFVNPKVAFPLRGPSGWLHTFWGISSMTEARQDFFFSPVLGRYYSFCQFWFDRWLIPDGFWWSAPPCQCMFLVRTPWNATLLVKKNGVQVPCYGIEGRCPGFPWSRSWDGNSQGKHEKMTLKPQWKMNAATLVIC